LFTAPGETRGDALFTLALGQACRGFSDWKEPADNVLQDFPHEPLPNNKTNNDDDKSRRF
jgi:hypothetical protein